LKIIINNTEGRKGLEMAQDGNKRQNMTGQLKED